MLSINDAFNLKCPNCGGTYLHHETVEVYNRATENHPQGLAITIRGQEVKQESSMDHNPSSRRDGIRIRFYCEKCPAHPVFLLSQHKGETYLEFTQYEDEDY